MLDEGLGVGAVPGRAWLSVVGLVAMSLAVEGCTVGDGDLVSSSDPQSAADGTLGGRNEGCTVASTATIGWAETTEYGTPAEVFARFSGTCEAPFSWDATGWTDTLTVAPTTGQSTITVTVDVDRASARLVEYVPSESLAFGDSLALCGTALEVDATVTLTLPDATVVAQQTTAITISEYSAAATAVLSVDETDFGDWVVVTTASDATVVTMTIQITPVGDACAGDITLSAVTASDGMGMGVGQGSFAQWSSSGCGVGQSAVSLDEPYQGLDLALAVSDAFRQAELAGTWSNGGTTTLTVATSVAQTELCAEPLGDYNVVTIPVDVVASSADGRVAALSGRGTVRATLPPSGPVELDLWLSTDLVCQSETDALAYRSVDCATVESVTAQLSFNDYGGLASDDGGGLELYVYERNGSAAPGAADRVDTLSLSH